MLRIKYSSHYSKKRQSIDESKKRKPEPKHIPRAEEIEPISTHWLHSRMSCRNDSIYFAIVNHWVTSQHPPTNFTVYRFAIYCILHKMLISAGTPVIWRSSICDHHPLPDVPPVFCCGIFIFRSSATEADSVFDRHSHIQH